MAIFPTTSPIQALKLAWRLTQREWSSSEVRILFFALVVAIAATTTISYFSEGLRRALFSQSAELLGGDMVVRGSRALDPAWLERAQQSGFETAALTEFGSVLIKDEQILLTSVKAVSDRYPLRGALRTASSRTGADKAVSGAVPVGEVWVDRRVMDRLGLSLGDRVQIGMQSFRVSAILTHEPDRGGNFFNLSPRVLMNAADLAATAVVQPGSRVRYSYLFANGPVEEFQPWLESQLTTGQRLVSLQSEPGGAGQALTRAELYLRLISLMAVMLSAVAIAMAARRYSERQYDVCAMLACLGATQKTRLRIYWLQLLIITLIAGVLGCALGWGAQRILQWVLQDMLPAGILRAGWLPTLQGFATGAVILLGTALPALWRALQVSPLRALRRDLEPVSLSGVVRYGFAIGAIGLVIMLVSRQVVLTLLLFLVIVGFVLLLYLLIKGLIDHYKKQVRKPTGVLGRALLGLVRRSRSSAGQTVAFAITFMMMLVILQLRTELLDQWQQQLPDDAPNHFAFNIMPHETRAFSEMLIDLGVEPQPIYPMVRGRLIAINGSSVEIKEERQDDREEALTRELNLTWAQQAPANNRLLEGQWWQPGQSINVVSVESELAQRLGLALNDELTFNIGGEEIKVRVQNLRSVQWESFTPNFYMIFPPQLLDQMPAQYITSFRLTSEQNAAVLKLAQAFPAVTLLEVEVFLQQLKRIFQQVTLAVEIMLLFVLAAGFAVLFACVQVSLSERLQESALLRVLGAQKRFLVRSNLLEYALLGFFSGLLAWLGAQAINGYIYHQIFRFEEVGSSALWLLAPIVTALLVAVVGYASTRTTLTRSPKTVLLACE